MLPSFIAEGLSSIKSSKKIAKHHAKNKIDRTSSTPFFLLYKYHGTEHVEIVHVIRRTDAQGNSKQKSKIDPQTEIDLHLGPTSPTSKIPIRSTLSSRSHNVIDCAAAVEPSLFVLLKVISPFAVIRPITGTTI